MGSDLREHHEEERRRRQQKQKSEEEKLVVVEHRGEEGEEDRRDQAVSLQLEGETKVEREEVGVRPGVQRGGVLDVVAVDDDEMLADHIEADLIFSDEAFPSLPDFPCLSSPSNAPCPTSSSSSSSSSVSSSSRAVEQRQHAVVPLAPSAVEDASMSIPSPPPHQNQPRLATLDSDCSMDLLAELDLLASADDGWDPSSLFPGDGEENDTNAMEGDDPILHQHEHRRRRQQEQGLLLRQQQQHHLQCLTLEDGLGRAGCGGGCTSEELAMVFLEWLRTNKESISPQDLRSIRLRRSTIECAARNLGGGREGMKRLLKLILAWVQNNHLQKKRRPGEEDPSMASTYQHQQGPLLLSPPPPSHSSIRRHLRPPPKPPPRLSLSSPLMRFLSLPVLRNPVPNPSFFPSHFPRFLLPPILLGSASSPTEELSPGVLSGRSPSICARNPPPLRARGVFAWRLSSPSWFCSRGGAGGGAGMEIAAAAAKAAEEGSVARRLWIKSQMKAVVATYTPFVVCLAAGGLELDVFRRYIAQDVHFLRAFAQAYEMAEDCADDDDAKAAISNLRKSVLKELKMHGSVVEEWGVDVTKEIIPNPATIKYTNFLLATAAGKVEGGKGPAKIVTPFEKTKIAAYTVAAMTPCMRLYAHLGKEILKLSNPDENSHPYRKWIDTYSSSDFEAAAMHIEELLDRLSISLTGEELEVLEKLYLQAIKLEIEFFCAQAIDQQTIVPLTRFHDPSECQLVLFSDFDLTCTVVDSSAILAEIAILSAPKAELTDSNNSHVQKSSTELRNSWDVLSSQYTEEYEECIENILTTEEAEEFDYVGLRKALEQLSEFEKRANMRVCDSGVLRGLNIDDIKRAGECLILQDGCRSFFQNILTKKDELNADIHVLSYCWCGDLIRSAFSSGGLDVLDIHANEFNYEESISTGDIMKNMETPLDKIRTFKDILNNCGDKSTHFSVYIGDSVGDLLCLLEADIGIVIGSSASLRSVGSHYGVAFVPLFPGLVKKQRQLDEKDSCIGKRLSGVLYTVSSWAEVHAFILGV